MPSETYGRNGGTPIFRSFHRTASSTTGGWSRWNILMCFIYIILSTTVLFLGITDAILFLQGLLFLLYLGTPIFCVGGKGSPSYRVIKLSSYIALCMLELYR